MIKMLKRRLTMIYGITSSIVLTIIILCILLLNYFQNYEQTLLQFQKNAEQVVEKIRSDNIINNAWMKRMEQENHLLVVVEENGKRLSQVSRSASPDYLEDVISKLKQEAETEAFFLTAAHYPPRSKRPQYLTYVTAGESCSWEWQFEFPRRTAG
jgi:predicted RND superfamily exporter protein